MVRFSARFQDRCKLENSHFSYYHVKWTAPIIKLLLETWLGLKKEEEEEEEEENCDYDDDGGPTSQLPNEILHKRIDFALTGTGISIIITYNSVWQLGKPFEELTMRFICRLPRISYNHRDTARNGCFSLRKLCKEFGPYSGFVTALKEIIASPR